MTTNPTKAHSASIETTALNREELENYILAAMDHWDVPGLSIAIVKDGETVLAKGYGTREIGKNLPVDEHTLFSIASSTMSFTATALAILVDENQMDWNDRMVDLLPGFKTSSDIATNYTTVIDVLAHRTGLPPDSLSFYPNPDFSRAEILSRMKHIESTSEFRSQNSPSFQMYTAAGEAIPALTGISWDDFVSDRLFTPIGMADSITGPHLFGGNQNVATPHETVDGALISVPHANTSNIGPAISIYSSAADMAKWLSFQLNNGKVADNVIISEEQINTLRSSHNIANFEFPEVAKNFLNQGLGFLISDSSMGACKLYSSGGNTEGTESYHAFAPELRLGVAVMVNSSKVIPQPLVAWIIDRYTQASDRDWINERTTIHDTEIESILSSIGDKQQEITDLSTKPSLAISSYAGLYKNPVVGDLKLQACAEALSFTLGTTYEGDLIHANHDTFFSRVKKPILGKFFFNGPAQFRLDGTGRVSNVFIAGKEFQKVD